MKDQPLVSIIIPSYNRGTLISQTLESVLNQTYPHWEAIVVDDGSTDNTLDIVNAWVEKNNRIKLFKRDREPKGAPTCRNIGLQKSSGKFVIYLDSDDLIAPHCLMHRVECYIQNTSPDFLVFPILLFDREIHDTNVLWNIDTQESDLYRFLRTDALWQTTGPIYKKSALLRVGGFREDLPFWQDFDIHLRCLLLGLQYTKFMSVKPDVYHRRNFVDSISRTIGLVSDKAILQKRIDYFFSLSQFIKQHNIILDARCHQTIWSVVFFFIASYIVRHKELGLYGVQLWRAKNILRINLLTFLVTFCYGVSLAISKRVRFFKIFSRLYKRIFNARLPDYGVMGRNTVGKKKWGSAESTNTGSNPET